MAAGLQILDLRASLEPNALLTRRARLAVESVRVRFSCEGLTALLPRDAEAAVERIGPDRIHARVRVRGIATALELEPDVAPSGRLAVRIVAARAGFLPLPPTFVSALLPGVVPLPRGVHPGEGGQFEVDVRAVAADWGVELPPLRRARAEEGALELTF